MYSINKNLASLLSSRLCHDLANPLGAIQNGLELMELSGAHRTPEFELTVNSVQSANARLNFYRIAFGPNKSGNSSARETAKILTDVYANTRCQVQYKIAQDISLEQAKLLFLLVLCLESSLPRGGQILLTANSSSFIVAANGININCDNEKWDHLLGVKEHTALTPAEIHFELARISVQDASRNIDITRDDTQVEIRI